MNLVSFIQSRGRARSSNSRYLVFIDESQKRSVKDWENQESILRYLINNEGATDQLPTQLSRRIKSEIESHDAKNAIEQPKEYLSEADGKVNIVLLHYP